MTEVKKVEKTAESGGIQNVGPGPDDVVVVDTAVRQAAATVPGTEAAAKEAMPSDAAIKSYLEHEPPPKSFRDTVVEREAARKAGVPENNEAYPQPHREVKPSARTEREMSRGSKAQKEATHQQGNPEAADVAGRVSKEHNRNVEAEKQIERVTGEPAPPEKKAIPSSKK